MHFRALFALFVLLSSTVARPAALISLLPSKDPQLPVLSPRASNTKLSSEPALGDVVLVDPIKFEGPEGKKEPAFFRNMCSEPGEYPEQISCRVIVVAKNSEKLSFLGRWERIRRLGVKPSKYDVIVLSQKTIEVTEQISTFSLELTIPKFMEKVGKLHDPSRTKTFVHKMIYTISSEYMTPYYSGYLNMDEPERASLVNEINEYHKPERHSSFLQLD